MAPRDIFLNMGWFGRSFGCNGRIKVSSTALDSYGSLLFNAASLAIIRAVLAMIQHERSASKTKHFRDMKIFEIRKTENFVDFEKFLNPQILILLTFVLYHR